MGLLFSEGNLYGYWSSISFGVYGLGWISLGKTGIQTVGGMVDDGLDD